jgi:hypothetical protein
MTGGAVLKAALAGASRRLVQTVVVFVVLAMATTATLATITIGLTSTMGAGRLAAIRNGAYLRMVQVGGGVGAASAGCDNRRMPERLEVQRAVAASAGEIFAVLTDPRGHVAIDSSGMLMEASGNIVAKVGDTFVVHMDREALNDYPLGLYDVTVEIVTFEPDQEIAWTVHGQLDLGQVYGYRLEPIEEGTLVTSYYDWSGAEQAWKDAAIFPVIPEGALRATLGILARTVAPGKPRPASSTR